MFLILQEQWKEHVPLTASEQVDTFLALNSLLRTRLAYTKIPEAVQTRVGVWCG